MPVLNAVSEISARHGEPPTPGFTGPVRLLQLPGVPEAACIPVVPAALPRAQPCGLQTGAQDGCRGLSRQLLPSVPEEVAFGSQGAVPLLSPNYQGPLTAD